MINNDKSGLRIFDNFQIDFSLKKWRNPKRNPKGIEPDTMGAMDVVSGTFTRFNRRRGNMLSGGMGFMPTTPPMNVGGIAQGVGVASPDYSPDYKEKGPSLFERIFHRGKLKRLEEAKRKREKEMNEAAMNAPNFTVQEIEPTEEISIEEFFTGIKGSAEELQLATERLQNYEAAIAHLRKTGQIALLEQMEHQLEVHAAETRLYALGLRKVVTEKNVTDFAAKSSKELCLDWIKNFARSIPSKVVDMKMKTDENEIFDNYVILHYDPLKNGKLLTNEENRVEEIKKKDPILFGVIAGSNKLYYIADWIDEYCDLTFDKMIETLGEKAISVNDLTVNVQQVVE
jgi:hypothetical protein